jgi:hypothetical protein
MNKMTDSEMVAERLSWNEQDNVLQVFVPHQVRALMISRERARNYKVIKAFHQMHVDDGYVFTVLLPFRFKEHWIETTEQLMELSRAAYELEQARLAAEKELEAELARKRFEEQNAAWAAVRNQWYPSDNDIDPRF